MFKQLTYDMKAINGNTAVDKHLESEARIVDFKKSLTLKTSPSIGN